MSKKANKTLIGVFVVAALAMLAAGIIVLGSGKFFTEKNEYVAYFEGSVKGLRVGAPVMFRGVAIGEVTDIALHFYAKDLDFKIPVMITLYADKVVGMGLELEPREEAQLWDQLLKRGFRAELQMQSLVTGQLFVQLDFYENTPLKLYGLKDLKLGPEVKEIPTIQSSLQALGKKIEQIPLDKIIENLQSTLQAINNAVNSTELSTSLQFFKQILEDVRNVVRNLDQKVDPLLAQVDQTLSGAQTLIKNIDNQVDPVAASFKSTSDDARKLLNKVDGSIGPLQADLKKTMATLRSSLDTAESAIQDINSMIAEESDFRYYIDRFLREITLAARSIRALADYLERNPDALLRGKVTKEEKGR